MNTMEVKLISLEGIEALKKQKRKLWIFVILFSLGWVAFTVCAFVFQNRSTQLLWIVLGTIITSFWLITLGYTFTKVYAPLRHYEAFSIQALSKERVINSVRVCELHKEAETYKGFRTLIFDGEEVDEANRKMIFRYEDSADIHLEAGRVYEVEAYDDVVVRIKEIS
ncbi:MAG: hypothetical protein WCS90_05260 [Bacilli bacterium]